MHLSAQGQENRDGHSRPWPSMGCCVTNLDASCHTTGYSHKARCWSLEVFLAKFAPIVKPGHQHSLGDAVAFPSYPDMLDWRKMWWFWLAEEVFDKL
ncbi:hypothetical protein TNCV_4683301 [Trichonephila clavipes]|nr:hypothetical protein TNCV_4683301 [Trichonephila clavipes]